MSAPPALGSVAWRDRSAPPWRVQSCSDVAPAWTDRGWSRDAAAVVELVWLLAWRAPPSNHHRVIDARGVAVWSIW